MTVHLADPRSVLVVGAGAAGLAAVEALRRRRFAGLVTVLGAEPWAPYDRPPLSKQILAGSWTPDRARLRPDDVLASLEAEWVLGDGAAGLDVAARTVTTAGGRTLTADAVVIATGARPRRLPGQDELRGVHVVRTLDDALALQSDLQPGRRLVVIGDGVLGTEIAATARTLGLDVTLTGPQPLPMAAQLGPIVAGELAGLHRERGTTLRLGAATTGLVGDGGRVAAVIVVTGEVLPADVVVVALGAVPDVAWLHSSGLQLDDGVVCDAYCRAAPGVYAVGDVARFHHQGLGREIRLENRTNASEQAGTVAANILGEDNAYAPVPCLWTDQYDVKLQVHGLPGGEATDSVVEGDLADRRFVVAHHREGALVGVVGWRMPKQTLRLRQQLVPAFTPVPTALSA